MRSGRANFWRTGSLTPVSYTHLDVYKRQVSTQIPYAMIPAACCVISYLVAGFTQSLIATLVTGFALMILILMLIKWSTRRKAR